MGDIANWQKGLEEEEGRCGVGCADASGCLRIPPRGGVHRQGGPSSCADSNADNQVATHVHTYPFKNSPKRDEDAFGVEQHGRIILAETSQLESAIRSMEEACQ